MKKLTGILCIVALACSVVFAQEYVTYKQYDDATHDGGWRELSSTRIEFDKEGYINLYTFIPIGGGIYPDEYTLTQEDDLFVLQKTGVDFVAKYFRFADGKIQTLGQKKTLWEECVYTDEYIELTDIRTGKIILRIDFTPEKVTWKASKPADGEFYYEYTYSTADKRLQQAYDYWFESKYESQYKVEIEQTGYKFIPQRSERPFMHEVITTASQQSLKVQAFNCIILSIILNGSINDLFLAPAILGRY